MVCVSTLYTSLLHVYCTCTYNYCKLYVFPPQHTGEREALLSAGGAA